MKLLALETSCDETAVAVLDVEAVRAGKFQQSLLFEMISSQAALHQPYGGVVPELAAREHVVNLPLLVKEALERTGLTPEQIGAVAVTRGPGLKGCLLVGLGFAKGLCFGKGIPLYPVHHLEGHLVAPLLAYPVVRYPLLTLLVSGGHTTLVLAAGFGDYKVIARTRDDAAGEAFDKIATVLGLPYPGGPSLSKLAEGGDVERFRFPVALPGDPSSFSFSGLKTSVLRTVNTLKQSGELQAEKTRKDLAASVEFAIVRNLITKTLDAARTYDPAMVALGGGVAANRLLRSTMLEKLSHLNLRCLIPPPKWCTDNAAMVGLAAALRIVNEGEKLEQWRALPVKASLGPDAEFDLSPECYWPIEDTAAR